jgi:hypothetical protein
MPFVRAVLDLAKDPLPVCLVGVVPLKEHLEAEALGRVAHLLLAESVDPPVDVLPRHERLELLEPHEILLVQRAQPVDGHLEVTDQLLDLLGCHGEGPG